MWFDCVVGETREPGRHFRANFARQHLPPSFAGDRRGTAGRGRWQRDGRAFFFLLSQALHEEAVDGIHAATTKTLIRHLPPSHPRFCFLKAAVHKMSKQGAQWMLAQHALNPLRPPTDEQASVFHLDPFLSLSSVPHQGDVWAECGLCGG